MCDQQGKGIKPPQYLGAKVTVSGPGAVDAAALEWAEAVISDLASNCVNGAKEDTKKLETAFTAFQAAGGGTEQLVRENFQNFQEI